MKQTANYTVTYSNTSLKKHQVSQWVISLNERKDIEVIEYIIQTNWLRVFLESVQAVVAFIIIYLSLKRIED